jgi:hypothetical protein
MVFNRRVPALVFRTLFRTIEYASGRRMQALVLVLRTIENVQVTSVVGRAK